jgi:hypothetical protein
LSMKVAGGICTIFSLAQTLEISFLKATGTSRKHARQ